LAHVLSCAHTSATTLAAQFMTMNPQTSLVAQATEVPGVTRELTPEDTTALRKDFGFSSTSVVEPGMDHRQVFAAETLNRPHFF
jgi:hypothetical protein